MHRARTVHECAVFESMLHLCTVAFGSGREGGTCWGDQLSLPARPALQKAGSFFVFWEGGVESPPPLKTVMRSEGERCGEPTSSLGAEARSFPL